MSILIRGMEMPKNCARCIYSIWSNLYQLYGCAALRENDPVLFDRKHVESSTVVMEGRADNCPLVYIPPHGRLVDADELEQDAQKRLLECEKYNEQFQKPYEVMRAIALAPTIIPADKEGDG